MTIRSHLAALLEARGLSTHKLSKLSGVPQVMVWRFAHGTAPKGLVAAYKLAAALHCSVTDIWPDLPVVARRRPQRAPQHDGRRPAPAGTPGRRRTAKRPAKSKKG